MNRDQPDKALTRRVGVVIGRQLLIATLAALGFYWAQGLWQAQSALYGGGVNIVMTLLLGRGIERAGRAAEHSARHGMFILVIGVIQRFVLVLVLFGVGFALLKLDPLASIVGFALTHLAYLIGVRESVNK